ncbi:monovalent cation/H+ antiporter subunit D family protein [Dermabacteraceae bacterium TAE3-ERU27]|nr:monovalent cation/H+ antiporter subunit D family protein [Dermabacteraceae bacterium TAE3-ERU27]
MNPVLLPLFVAIPMAGAALTIIFRQRRFQLAVLTLVPTLIFAGGGWLLATHQETPVIAHNVGGYVEGIAIPFVSDSFSALMLMVTSLAGGAAIWFMTRTGEIRYRAVPALTLLLLAGVNGALLTGDLFNLFVWVEVMLMPSYALIAVTGTWRRLGVGRMFVLVNLLTSTVLLIGVGMVYGTAGTVNLALLSGAGNHNPVTAAALGIVLLALAVKAGVVPVHGWLPRSYPATSAGIMALFSALHTKVALVAMYRIVSVTFRDGIPFLGLFTALVVVTMVVGAFSTTASRWLRSALAFQMVAGVGHILIGLVLLTEISLAAGILYMVHHIVTMSALVMSTGAIEHVYGTGRLDYIRGLARRDPVVITVIALGFFSLVGLPPTSGLWGKLALVNAAGAKATAPLVGAQGIDTAYVLIGAVILASIGSMLALQQVWRTTAWGAPMETYRPDDESRGRGDAVPLPDTVRIPFSLAAPSVAMMGVSVAMFLGIGLIMPYFQAAAHSLIDVDTYVKVVLGK